MVDDRFTVRLPEDLAEWVHRETDERERPKAWVIAEAVRTAKGATIHIRPTTSRTPTSRSRWRRWRTAWTRWGGSEYGTLSEE